MKFRLASLALSLALVSCATNPEKVHDVDTKLDVKGNIGDSKIGINDKNEAIIQQEHQAQDELTMQDAVNMRLQDDANHYEGELKECLTYIADKRLGGNGTIPEIPDVSNLKTDDDITEDMGTDKDGTLKIVKKSSFRQRLIHARSYEKSLRAITKLLKKQDEQCEMNLELARNKVGLPGKKTAAEGYFNKEGKWVETKRGETNVNDAFEIQANNASKSGH
ncbi:MAG: hypothetical protein H7318_19710 [Oligoflexus sp.]|nr:hypothetical protein [Oligoflexus sp.]